MYEHVKRNSNFIRLVVVKDGYASEGLIKRVGDLFRKNDPEWEKKTRWQQFIGAAKHRDKVRFNSFDEIESYVKQLNDPKDKKVNSIIFNGKEYTSVDLDNINFKEDLSLTTKQIDVRSWKDLEKIFNLIKKYQADEGVNLQFGFVTIDSLMSLYNQAYKPFRFKGGWSNILAQLQYLEKLLMRFNYGFIMRNYLDTWTQLYSELYKDFGVFGAFKNRKQIVRIMGLTHDVYNIYKDVSEERLLSLLEVKTAYDKMLSLLLKKDNVTNEEVLTITENFYIIKDRLKNYIDGAEAIKKEDVKKRIETRLIKAKEISQRLEGIGNYILNVVIGVKDIKDLDNIKVTSKFKNVKALKNITYNIALQESVAFLGDTRFAEYFTLYDSLKFNPGETNLYRQRINKRLEKYKTTLDSNGQPVYSADYEDLKKILFEVSAFMQTNAQVDVYRQETFEYLRNIVEERKLNDFNDTETRTFKEVYDEIEKEKNGLFNKGLLGLVHKGYKYTYSDLNANIENVGRIAGYLLDRQLRGYTFQEAVNSSLKRFFNYGLRSPLEMQLLADIPYLSFPVRSLTNWIDRILDPRMSVLLSDIIDGVYGQYTDDDGEYSPFELFEMQNGWLRIYNGVGIRLGFGLFDVQKLLSDPGRSLLDRQRPLLRGLSKFLETKDVLQSIRQLAIAGPISNVLNKLPVREQLTQGPLAPFVSKNKNPIIPLSSGILPLYTVPDYEKYTPKRYRYLYGSNGRWAKYENIYRDWFTKYGTMRKPRVNPYSLVKNTKWRQYVRYRRSRVALR
jgi:hypothetical protein